MKCEACTTSEADPLNDAHWQAGCIGCEARALASIGAHVESLDRRALTPAYRSALERLLQHIVFDNFALGVIDRKSVV